MATKTNGRPTVAQLKNEVEQLKRFAALSVVSGRANIAARLGKSYAGERDIYEALGYAKSLSIHNFMARYQRQDIAKAVIEIPVRACWRDAPEIEESEEDETEFEAQWKELEQRHALFKYLSRADKLGSLGQYAVVLLGFDDTPSLEAMATEVRSATDLRYIQVYSESNADIKTFDLDPKSARFGLPEIYNLRRVDEGQMTTPSMVVHWSRVLHVTEDNLESDVYGTPRLQAIYNRLQDLELVSGGSAEMFWRQAFPGLAFLLSDDAQVQDQTLDDMTDEVEEYMHDLKRYLRLIGMDVKQLMPQVADPRSHVDVQLDLISAASRIPRRMLLGSERGELASTQDERNWAQRVEERRTDHCEPNLLRPLIDRLIEVGVLPEPTDGYTVKWPDLLSPSLQEKVDVGATMAKALKDYLDAGGDQVLPLDFFLAKLGFETEEIEKINEVLEAIEAERDREREEEAEAEEEAAGAVVEEMPEAVGVPAVPAAEPV
jgi:phage-related protein (TIGR01555 family)